MARAYTVGTLALTIDMPVRWVDNVLSHHNVPGVSQERQGVARKVAFDGVLHLALALKLIQDFEIPLAAALNLAYTIVTNGGRYDTPTGIMISIDMGLLRTRIEARLAEAVEITPVPKRGRPPGPDTRHSRKTGRL